MNPTNNRVYVEKTDVGSPSKFKTVDTTQAKYFVTKIALDVTKCNVGDFVLFTDYKTYKYNNNDIIIVNESDIDGVERN